MAVQRLHYSCKKAFDLLAVKDTEEVKNRLYEIFGCSTWQQFYQKRKDYVNIPAHTKEEVEVLFLEYGIRKEEVWEITEE